MTKTCLLLLRLRHVGGVDLLDDGPRPGPRLLHKQNPAEGSLPDLLEGCVVLHCCSANCSPTKQASGAAV